MHKKPLVFLVDPQSYTNLAKYDAKLVNEICKMGVVKVEFYGSVLFDRDSELCVRNKPIFKYQIKSVKLFKILSYAISLFRLFGTIWIKRPAIIHIQWIKFPPVDFIFYNSARLVFRSRLVYTSHNVVPHGSSDARHFFLHRFLKICDRIIVHHQSSLKELVERFGIDPSAIEVIHHGPIPLDDGLTSLMANSLLQKCCGKKLVFGFVGSGTYYKGLDILIRAWKRVPHALRSESVLLICGKVQPTIESLLGGYKWHEGVTGLIVFNRYLSEADLNACVLRMDVVVLPHRKISQSGVLLSLLDKNVAFVAASQPAFKDVVAKYDLGWVYDGSEEALAELLKQCLMQPKAVASIRNNVDGRRRANEFVSWESAAAATVNAYFKSLGLNR